MKSETPSSFVSSALPSLSEAATQVEPFEPKPGDVLDGRYVLEEPIGEGGVGTIFRAIQFKVQRPVAVKFLQRAMLGEHKSRFEREALALAALAHPNIVRLQDYGFARSVPFLVMEYVEGYTLRELLSQAGGRFEILRALSLVRQILYALAYAHERGLVHRDLKPANVIVQELPAQPEHLKVLDFGFVKPLPGSELDHGGQLTRSGYTFGSPPYMSPEHATGSPVDGRSDLYSVGVLLFEMLTGRRPFTGNMHQLLRHHLTTKPPPLIELAPELADYPQLQLLIDRALAKKPDQRFADAAEFVQHVAWLESCYQQPISAVAQNSAEPEAALAPEPQVQKPEPAQTIKAPLLAYRPQPRFRTLWSRLGQALGLWHDDQQ